VTDVVVSKIGIVPRSTTRDQIEARLQQLLPNESVSWDVLERLTGRPRSALYQITKSARESLRRDYKLHFKIEHGAGVRRIDHAEVAREVVPSGTRKLRSQANRNLRVISDIVLDDVPAPDRVNVIAHASISAFVRAATTARAVKLLSGEQTTRALTPEEAAKKLFLQAKATTTTG
jgi:hypothetical protein